MRSFTTRTPSYVRPAKRKDPDPCTPPQGAAPFALPGASGVGRIVEDGTDEDQARVERLDGGGGRAVAHNSLSFHFFVEGGSYPELCAQRPDWGGEDFFSSFLCCRRGGGPAWFLLFLRVVYVISLRGEGPEKRGKNKIIK